MQTPCRTIAVPSSEYVTYCISRTPLQSDYPPLFDTPAWGIPFEFLDETYPAKTRGMGLLYGENCMILASTVFD